MPILYGRFAAPGEWTEISSRVEGHFLERIGPTALEKTIAEKRDRICCLFHHGQDPQIGMKVLGPVRELRADSSYEVGLLDVDYVRSLIPGLRQGLYGASFRFRVVSDEIRKRPGSSEHNPMGLPEITVTQADVFEFGPTPMPAYKGASAGVRSSAREIVREGHASAYTLGKRERWATRSKPGCPGVVERQRVFGDQLAAWETREPKPRPWWWLPDREPHRAEWWLA
jgi:phage head maturation protease